MLQIIPWSSCILTPHTVTDMLVAVLNTCSKEELEDNVVSVTSLPLQLEKEDRRRVIKNKILAVGRMARVFALLRYVLSLAGRSTHR